MKYRKQKILLLLSVVLSLVLAFTATFFTASAADTESNRQVIVVAVFGKQAQHRCTHLLMVVKVEILNLKGKHLCSMLLKRHKLT